MTTGPLADVRVIAVEQYGAGPFGSLLLADLGADVIKIEDPRTGGDIGRYVPPYSTGESSLFFETFNRNKRSLSLDLTTPGGLRVLHDLVRVSDAVYSNLRGDVPDRIGITYQHLGSVNPKIVCCSLTGFGMTGPMCREPAYDYILQGIAGWMSVTGEPDGPPTKSGLSLVDFSGGLVAALALVSAVHGARRDGVGADCDVSLFDTSLGLLTYLATWHLSRGWQPTRMASSAHPSLVPFQNFQTADGWLVVGAAKEKFWGRMATVLRRPDLATDPRFATFSARAQNVDELLEIIQGILLTRPTAEWLFEFRSAGVPCGPINSIEAALREQQAVARDMLLEYKHPELGTVRTVRSPVSVGSSKPDTRRAPFRNEHAGDVLGSLLGYGAQRIAELKEAGALGDWPSLAGETDSGSENQL